MARIIFMGTPTFATYALQQLIHHHEVLAVVTQPDRPVGRKRQLQPPPVKSLAQSHNIPVYQPEKLRRKRAIDELEALGIPDVYIVAAFGQILPERVLNIPHHGSLNIHASLLPRWRGAAPIQAAIKAGDTETGITMMQMDVGLDTGPILTQEVVPITTEDTGTTLHDKLAEVGAKLMLETLPDYLAGRIAPKLQNDALATFAPQIQKRDGAIQWQQTAAEIDQHVRAYTPWPGTFTQWNGKTLKILSGRVHRGDAPAGVVVASQAGIGVGTGAGIYLLEQVQLAGGKATAAEDFINGYPDFVGAVLG